MGTQLAVDDVNGGLGFLLDSGRAGGEQGLVAAAAHVGDTARDVDTYYVEQQSSRSAELRSSVVVLASSRVLGQPLAKTRLIICQSTPATWQSMIIRQLVLSNGMDFVPSSLCTNWTNETQFQPAHASGRAPIGQHEDFCRRRSTLSGLNQP